MSALPALRQPRRGLWLMTFADLALLLVCFFVLLRAIDAKDAARRADLAGSLREAFTAGDTSPLPAPPLALEVAAIGGFAPGSAVVTRDLAPIVEWARTAAADPRAFVIVSGEADAAERGPLTISASRAEAVAAALVAARFAPPTRIRAEALGARPQSRRRVLVRISYQP